MTEPSDYDPFPPKHADDAPPAEGCYQGSGSDFRFYRNSAGHRRMIVLSASFCGCYATRDIDLGHYGGKVILPERSTYNRICPLMVI